jgi:thiamine-monophosphate kinase
MDSAASRIGLSIEGGETIQTDARLGLSITVLGSISEPARVCTRSGARVGDLVCVSGPLGGAAAGLYLLQHGIEGYSELKQKHLEPQCRVDVIDSIAVAATSMIDISDGLSSELHHIARASGVRLSITEADVPLAIAAEVQQAYPVLHPLDCALNGGEDFELLYTVARWDASLPGSVIGEVLPASQDPVVVMKCANGDTSVIEPKGYAHCG